MTGNKKRHVVLVMKNLWVNLFRQLIFWCSNSPAAGHIKLRAAHSDQIYIHSRCVGIDMRTRGFLPKIQGKNKVSATATLTCKAFVRRFGWNFKTNFLLSLASLENLFLLLRTPEGCFRQETQNKLLK